MTTRPVVSIVTPSLNQGRYIGETVDSVLRQTYPAIEYVVLDAGSSDETHGVLASFGDRVRWCVEPDNGQSDAINKGWRAATGDIVAWLCADDLLEPDAVERAVDALATQPEAAAVYGQTTLFADDGSEWPATPPSPFHLWGLINVVDYISQPATFFRRDAVEAVGWLDEGLHYCMDWDLLIRLGLRYPLTPIATTLARARIHPAAKTVTGGRPRFRELVRMMRRYADSRRPPAYWLYGIETYRGLAEAALARRSALLRRAALPLVRKTHNLLAKRTFLAVDDWFPDGWAGPRVRLLVPPGRGVVRLRGDIPTDLAPQTLTVTAARENAWSGTLAAGPFDIAVPSTTSDAAVPLGVNATRWKTLPHPHGHARRAAYRLTAVGRV